MADEYIEKMKLLEQIDKDSAGNEGQYGDEWLFMDTISDMPTIDIVHCRDCKHIDRTICLTSFPEKYGCKLGNGAHRLDFFCSYGEREQALKNADNETLQSAT